MSREAVAYVRRVPIADERVRRVFLLVAERTELGSSPDLFGVDLSDTDVQDLSSLAGIEAEAFKRHLRELRQHIWMDVLEHPDGTWEIVYGPTYDQSAPPSYPNSLASGGRDRTFGLPVESGVHPFTMPGWDHYSTWGYDDGLECFYAQLVRNDDDPDVEPRIWITPPRNVAQTIDDLVGAIADELVRYLSVPPEPDLVRSWLARG